MCGVCVTLLAQYIGLIGGTNLFKLVSVWPERRPYSLSTVAGISKGVLGIRGSVGNRRRVLYV